MDSSSFQHLPWCYLECLAAFPLKEKSRLSWMNWEGKIKIILNELRREFFSFFPLFHSWCRKGEMEVILDALCFLLYPSLMISPLSYRSLFPPSLCSGGCMLLDIRFVLKSPPSESTLNTCAIVLTSFPHLSFFLA